MPPWLAARMAQLGAVICQAIVHHYGRDEFLRRLSHPFWFQSLGAVMGMDWHSSGITTSVIGALKRGLAPLQQEIGLHVCGGRGKQSRRTPAELVALGDRIGFDGHALTRTSRLVAKVDSAAVHAGRAILPIFFSCRASARERWNRWRWSPRSCTARHAGSAIRRGSRSPMAAKTAIRFRCRFASTTKPSGY